MCCGRAALWSLVNRHEGALSAEGFAALTFLTGGLCQSCALPQAIDRGEDTVCAACLARPPLWTHAHAALTYDDVSRIPILGLKRAGRRDGLKVMANWMVTAGTSSLAKADIIVAVPLHSFRLLKRGYNQSGWLASAISNQTGVQARHGLLNRVRPTPSQAGLSGRARYRNVRGAFDVPARAQRHLEGKSVVLIDDVLTTGATLTACTRALLKARGPRRRYFGTRTRCKTA